MDATYGRKHSINNNDNNISGQKAGAGEGDDDSVVGNSNANNPATVATGETCAAAVRRNPSILLALDSVHRSLLLKNLQFDREPISEDAASDSIVSGVVGGYHSEVEDPLETRKSSEVVKCYSEQHITEHYFPKQRPPEHYYSDEVDSGGILDLVKHCRDSNNNETSKVMMMVAKYELGRAGGKMAVDETETSDFDTASMSSSSLGSVRSSSAFSEVSRDVGSVGSYESEGVRPNVIGTGESHVVTAGAATITINIINKTAEDCDTRPLKTGPEMKAVHVQVPECESESERGFESRDEGELSEFEVEELHMEENLNDGFVASELQNDPSLYESALFHTAESQEFLDCKGSLDSSNCEYDESSEETEQSEAVECDHPEKNAMHQEVIDDENEPMINIIQEMTRDMQVTSTVILNKAKIKDLRKSRSAEKEKRQKSEKKKLENSHLSRQKIIDDNFCNEILDSTHQFDRLYGINRKTSKESPIEVLSDSALQEGSSLGDESFDSSMSFGKLEGKPRYSGRPIGKLMARRLKKLDKQIYSKSDATSDSSTSNYANGPKKPPRTFASARSHSSKIGWVKQSGSSTEASSEKPSCPKLQDLDSDPELIGWKFDKPSKNEKRDKSEKSHNFGWVLPKERTNDSSIPPHIYNMLHYSEDEERKQLIKTSNSRAAPQASCCHRVESKLGPKLDIDTVDYAPETPRRKSSSNLNFERFATNTTIKSTPHKRLHFTQNGRRAELFLESERGETGHRRSSSGRRNSAENAKRTELFLESERSGKQRHSVKEQRRRTTGDFIDHEREAESRHFLEDGRRSDHEPDYPDTSELCRKCKEKSEKKSFRKAAVRRTKSFFEASKKKIHKMSKEKQRFETPTKYQLDRNLNKENSIKKQLHKHLGYTPDNLRCGSCPKESTMVRNNLKHTYSAPARIPDDKKTDRPKLPIRTVLNSSVPEESLNEKDHKKQRPHEMKFLKTLKNLRISPKKLFKPHDDPKRSPLNSSSPRQHGDFQSYDDLNLDNVAQMGDFLNNVRQAVESERLNSHHVRILDHIDVARYAKLPSPPNPRPRHISTSSEFLDRSPVERQLLQVAADLHQEPIYQEISPKNNKTIINEFISGESNKRYLMVNNNPNVIYATVNKTAKNLIKTKSINSFCEEPLLQPPISVKKLNAQPKASSPIQLNSSAEKQSHRSSSSRLRRSLFNSSGDRSLSSLEESNGILVLPANETGEDESLAMITALQEVQEELIVPKSVGNVSTGISRRSRETHGKEGIDEVDDCRPFEKDIHLRSEGKCEAMSSEEQLFRTALMDDETIGSGSIAPLGSIDTDDEIESLQKYQDRGLDDLLTTLRENITISEIGTIDTESDASAFVTGYDTVDFTFKSASSGNNLAVNSESERVNSTIESELMSAREYSASNSSPSSDKMRLNGSDIYRSLRDRLRSSFRKSKRFIKNEHRKISNLFDDRTGAKREDGNRVAFNLDEYQRKYESDTDAEEMYQSLSNAGSLGELNNRLLAELVNQIKTQGDLKKQLKQALAVCRNTREFECSSELIEAERLMLLSTLKESAARNELSKIDYNMNGTIPTDGKKIGVVALNHFEFPLKETALNDMLFNYFYLAVCSYKNQVKATLAKERYEDRVYFRNGEIEFHDLDADYEIRVEVYVLRLRKNARNYSFESKYHLNKDNNSMFDSLPNSAKLRNTAKLLTSRSNSPKNFDFDNEFSRFKSQGYITLTASHLLPSSGHSHTVANAQLLESCHQSAYYSASSNFQQLVRKQGDHNVYLVEDFKYMQLDSTVYNSNLLGGIGMSIKSEVHFLNSDISGFLTVGDIRKGSIDWSRKWCKVNGFVLEFWNYPQECQEKLPTLQIDLTKCISEQVKLAEREICSRPRTLHVQVFAKGITSCSSSGISSYKDSDSNQNSDQQSQQHQQHSPESPSQSQQSEHIKNYLLSVDTPSELKMWLNELNRVVKFLKEWKI
ncbi:uncharacterized protein LOC134210379 [Armigeres subalbatus]|uniref:uncharacterized protein LOC134210379 n=1 Tax=Armigeres subalbatus TaxID=124917 RepID=UPI002ED585F6